jgi:hypothetical protein
MNRVEVCGHIRKLNQFVEEKPIGETTVDVVDRVKDAGMPYILFCPVKSAP